MNKINRKNNITRGRKMGIKIVLDTQLLLNMLQDRSDSSRNNSILLKVYNGASCVILPKVKSECYGILNEIVEKKRGKKINDRHVNIIQANKILQTLGHLFSNLKPEK